MNLSMVSDPFAMKDLTVADELQKLSDLARENNAQAQETLGFYLFCGADFYGRKVKQDRDLAIKLFKQAAEAKSGFALKFLASVLSSAEYSQYLDLDAAENYAGMLAETGDPAGCVLKGTILRDALRKPAEAAKWFEQAEKQGQTGCAYELALMYMQGFGVERDLNKAREIIDRNKDRDFNFDTLMGEFLLTPENRDVNLAAQYFEKAAKAGSFRAMAELARLYLFSPKVNKPANAIKIARSYVDKAIAGGDGLACFVKAHMYDKGLGVPWSPDKYFELLELGRTYGYRPCDISLAAFLMTVETDSMDEKELKDLDEQIKDSVERGVEEQCAQAYTLKGTLLQDGRIYPRDENAAYDCFIKAGSLGDSEGYIKGTYLAKKSEAVKKDEKEIRGVLEKAVELDDVDAYCVLGLMLLNSDDEGDAGKGIALLDEACGFGDGKAPLLLGDHYWNRNENPTAEDFRLAEKYYMKAIAAGNPEGHLQYALMFLDMNTDDKSRLKKNIKSVLRHLEAAIDAGVPEACSHLAAMYLIGYGVSYNEKKAFKLANRGAKLGDLESHRILAMCYREGVGTAPSEAKAAEEDEIFNEMYAELSPAKKKDYDFVHENDEK